MTALVHRMEPLQNQWDHQGSRGETECQKVLIRWALAQRRGEIISRGLVLS